MRATFLPMASPGCALASRALGKLHSAGETSERDRSQQRAGQAAHANLWRTHTITRHLTSAISSQTNSIAWFLMTLDASSEISHSAFRYASGVRSLVTHCAFFLLVTGEWLLKQAKLCSTFLTVPQTFEGKQRDGRGRTLHTGVPWLFVLIEP